MLIFQVVALGLLATGALGTSKEGPQVASTPILSTATAVAHDTSVPLIDAPDVQADPNRQPPLELERQVPISVNTPTQDPAVQRSVSGPAVAAPLGSFDGLKLSAMANQYMPPDTVGDVGLTQFVQAVNGGIAVFSKAGDNLTGSISDDSFWNGLPGCQAVSKTDPTVNYDQFDNRWVFSELAYTTGVGSDWSGPYYMCVAVSTTDDATDTWARYAFPVSPIDLEADGSHPALPYPVLPDYPKLAVWPDGYYLSFNEFSSHSYTGHRFLGAGAMVLERSAMLNGTAARSQYFDLRNVSGLTGGGMLPADADGSKPPDPGTPDYYVAPVDGATNDQLGVWEFHVDWAAPGNSSFTSPQALGVLPFDGVLSGALGQIPQPGTSQLLDALADDRLMNRLQYRKFADHEALVTNETVNAGSGVAAPRWYELDKPNAVPPAPASWSVAQQQTFSPDSVNRWIGSVAMNSAQAVALGYSAADGSTIPSLRYTGNVPGTDAASQMEPEGTLVAGGGVQLSDPAAAVPNSNYRWGDYSQMSVDPTDDCTFWFTGEYYSADGISNWSTRIGSFKLAACTASNNPVSTGAPTISGTMRERSTLTATAGTWSLLPQPDTFAYQWRLCDSSGIACANIGGATASTYVLQAVDAGKRLRVKVTATVNTPSGTSSVVSAATSAILPIAPANTAVPTISGTFQASQVVTSDTGSWTSSLPPTYAYSWERCSPGCSSLGIFTAGYTLTANDVGARVQVRVTASTTGGSASVYSAPSAVVQLPPSPTNLVAPSISGTVQETHTLTAQVGTWSGVTPISYTYLWATCSSSGTNCASTGLTTPTYILGSGDVGKTIRLTVTAMNAGGANSVNTVVSSAVLPAPPTNTGLPVLSGSAAVGSALVTGDGSWTSSAAYSIAYQWQSCASTCTNISGATSNRYDVTSAVAGTTLRAVVTATNAGGSTSVSSAASAAVPVPAGGSSGGSTGGSSGGGGGGGAGSPDLVVSGFPSNTAPLPGDNVTFMVTVTDKNGNPAQSLFVDVTLGSGLQYVTSTSDRGSGCVVKSATTLRCSLDWLSSDVKTGNLQITTKVIAGGSQSLVATASAQQGDSDQTNNTLTVSINSSAADASGVTKAPVGLNGDGTPTKKQDKKKPAAVALLTSAKRGAVAKLRFKIYDDQGVAKALTTVKRGTTVIGTASTGYGPVAYGSIYYVGWHVPAKAAKGKYSFCVTAVDRAGNKSARSCAPVALK